LRRSNSQRQQCNFHASTPDVVDGFITSLNKAGIHILKRKQTNRVAGENFQGTFLGQKRCRFLSAAAV
jgi:hypothetical protein